MTADYKISLGNSREDYTIYYEELQSDKVIRKLAVATDIKFRRFRKPVATIYLNSFQNWEVDGKELSLNEYTVVLKRIYDFLKSDVFEVGFNVYKSI